MPNLMKKILSRGIGAESTYAIHMSKSNGESLASYSCNCHCGAVKFTVLYPSLDTKQVLICNCSLCTAHGLIMVHPLRKHVTFQKGYDSQATYVTAKKSMKFCATCGMATIFDIEDPESHPDEEIGVNVRTMQGLDLDKLSYFYYDGASKPPLYEVPD